MNSIFRIIWVGSILINVVSLIWLIVGSTAMFQRSMTLTGRATFLLFGVLSILLILLSLIMFLMKLNQNQNLFLRIVILIISGFLIYLSIGNYNGIGEAEKRGWLYDSVQSDPIKYTEDGKYEYRLELVNQYQRNEKHRLYIKQIANGTEKYITLPLQTQPSSTKSILEKDWTWITMTTTNKADRYELTTTNQLGMPIQKFIVDIDKETTQRISVLKE